MSRMNTRCKFCLLGEDFFKQIFFVSFCFVPSFEIDSSVNLGMPRSTFFCGITETIPSLFRGIFSERNFAAKHSQKWTLSNLPSPMIFLPYSFSLISLSLYLFPLLSPFLLYFYPCHHIHSSYLSLHPSHISDPLSNLLLLPFVYPLIPHSSFITIILSLSRPLLFITLFPYPCPCSAA